MSFRSMPSFRSGGGGLDEVGLFCYSKGSRFRWIYAAHVALVSRLRLDGVADFFLGTFSRVHCFNCYPY